MWKFISRGIRETIERRACRTNVYSQTTTDECNSSEAKPSTNVKKTSLTNCGGTHGFCGFFQYRGTRDKKSGFNWNADRTLSDVLGWSSILAIGWAICQTPCIRKHIFERNRSEKCTYRILKCPKNQLSYLVKHALSLQPKHVLPVTNCVGSGGLGSSEAEQPAYGPITVEEALRAARDDYTRTHRVVMGEFELRYGMKAMQEQRYKDAIEHFLVGAQLKSPESMFNLGLCYELGIGTRMDSVKAVQYYQSAAEKGHPGAMYNLGVFHAQGRGGLPTNLDEARELFTKAASLGQTEAQDALRLDSNHNESTQKSKIDNVRHYQPPDPFAGIPDLSNNLGTNFESSYSKIKHPTDTLFEFFGFGPTQALMESN